ncbi:hypothetical protein Bpfe_030419 [Biomphalaria pfeifferi]|uniref:Corticotropin-releasing factor domain-containing protein n=1 Tax=Biomphalaria pfeifferi TaxID=112525 RepID=A0AAD8EU82_BIOPF|nr:hypothetical protein Bpfe_030419 [Biomphalaria pfeifferi]
MLSFMGVTLCLLLTLSPHSAEATPHSSGSRDWPTDAVLTPASSSVELMELQEDEAPHRLRRSAFLPLFSPFAKRVPISSDLMSLSENMSMERRRQARQEFMDMLKEMGK